MRVIRHLPRVKAPLPRVVLTLGNFDGVHLGHQAIIRAAQAQADACGGQVVAFTFHPHPLAVLAPDRAPAMIQSDSATHGPHSRPRRFHSSRSRADR